MPSAAQTLRGFARPRPGFSQQPENRGTAHDREVQDEVIRYLTDAKLRSGETNTELLDEDEAERARRFSRFLARRYYRDRLHRGFRYSATLISSAQAPEHVVESQEFDSILETCTLGSLETSRRVGRLALERVLPLRQEEWWSELLDYELAFFIQLATSETTVPDAVPKRNSSAILHRFQFRLPELLQRLRVGQSLAVDLRGEVTLLFSRTNHGKIYVVETDDSSVAIFAAIDGIKTQEEMARACAIPVDETRRILSTFSDIGTVVPPV